LTDNNFSWHGNAVELKDALLIENYHSAGMAVNRIFLARPHNPVALEVEAAFNRVFGARLLPRNSRKKIVLTTNHYRCNWVNT
jgi:hypothetical protein